MNRDEYERAIFEQALNLPAEEPERVIHAEDDPTLAKMVERAKQAWAAFLVEPETP